MKITELEKKRMEEVMVYLCLNCFDKDESFDSIKEKFKKHIFDLSTLNSRNENSQFSKMEQAWNVTKHVLCPKCKADGFVSYFYGYLRNSTFAEWLERSKTDRNLVLKSCYLKDNWKELVGNLMKE